MPPARCCSSVNAMLKSPLKSLPNDDAHGNVHPMRRLYACSFTSGARDTAESVTSWLARWTAKPSNPSAIVEQVAHPAVFVAQSRCEMLVDGHEIDYYRALNRGSDKCGGIQIDSLITAAACALAAGYP